MSDTLSNSQTPEDFTEANDPIELFRAWFRDAQESEISDANAMALATVDEFEMPNVRIVLLKDLNEEGFAFYTNLESIKGRELDENMKAGLCFHWKSLKRQVRVRGPLLPVSNDDADAYYNSRPMGSRIGAWASRQSQPLKSREFLKHAVEHFETKFEGSDPPRPEHWSGFRLTPNEMEFWHDRPFRLHDRVVFKRSHSADPWDRTRLFP